MFIQTFKSEGLSHLSYLIGNNGQAAVIDPRRDCEIYAEAAAAKGCRITHIFETHRNEDLISGAPILAQLTGAAVFHGPNAAGTVRYAKTTREHDEFSFGNLQLRVLETPGHTDDSLSFALYDTDFGDDAVAVFTGDALFVGDVGRTDFYPERPEEVAGLLFDSLQKLTSLGDQALIYPAHGAGSVCGDNMADREFSSIGYERRNNPMMQIRSREEFISLKVQEHHYQPPYFREMERLNMEGGRATSSVLTPAALSPAAFKDLPDQTVIIDVRGISSFLGAHIPGSLALPTPMIPAFAGWFLSPEDNLALVAVNASEAEVAARHLARIGFDNVLGYLAPDMPQWAAMAEPFRSVQVIDLEDFKKRRASPPENWSLLDVRGKGEVDENPVDRAIHHYTGNLMEEARELDPGRHYTVMCGSGARAAIAASVLMRRGFRNVDVFLGSVGALMTEKTLVV
ncbi:MBL fold metallo-hydrolase [Marinobacter sp. 1_MG-2023]|uniref:MBL fold metallo-hydrolase n=1 Tax=Marinobacter sp. 1_MG-2023 TaxID=3062627 RepID=UPI0026E43DA3|nr:MBL fold metallo-hydrolase [Marinobacter sp. 1_MG-2023]MDO6823234.1 MBL fold metallo-hydrolase [Marinobacter sp. 1_MG-2023]